MSPSHVSNLTDESLNARPGDRLLAPQSLQSLAGQVSLPALFVVFFFFHIVLLGVLVAVYGDEPGVAPEQEIAVEVINEPPPPPPPPKAEEPPPEPPKEKPPAKKAEQTPLFIKPAFDAPRQENKEKIEREASDEKSASPNQTPPTPSVAEKPAPDAQSDKPQAAAPVKAPEPTPVKTTEEKPDAETIENAELKPPAPDKPDAQAPVQDQAQNGAPDAARQSAALETAPKPKTSAAAKPAQVKAGTEEMTYFSILHGMIVPRLRIPASTSPKARGALRIDLDTIGHILYMEIIQPSGSRELDQAAINAVRAAAPFPPPPSGLPPIQFGYSGSPFRP